MGGITASRNRGGQYLRRRAIPTTSTTADALAAKARFAAGSSAWQALAAADRAAWKFWADANPNTNALGNQIILTGHQSYVGFYSRAHLAGETPLVVPPLGAAPAALASLALTADIGVGDVELAYTATPTGAAEKLWILGAIVNSPGIVNVESLYAFVGLSGLAEASPFGIEAAVIARLGTLTVGQTLHTKVSVFDNVTMRLSEPLVSSAVVESTV